MGELKINNIIKNFGTQKILNNVSLEIADGNFLVLVGPSGCGKSTLLSIIAGLEQQSSGSISISDKIVDQMEPKERDIAMVFQSYALYPAMTVEQNMGFALEMSDVAKSARRERVSKVAELLQITHLLQRKPAQLSGGQRQRVAIGRALVREPALFLFDEPLSNLDAKLRVEMRTEIKRLHQRLGTTIVYVTHDQIEAMTMATHIAVMKDGVIQQFGTPSDIYERPVNTFVATFMGSPAMNLIPAQVIRHAGRYCLQLENQIILPLPISIKKSNLIVANQVLLGLRPEWIKPANDNDAVTLEMNVDVVEPTGPDIYAALSFSGHDVMARLPADTAIESGKLMRFGIDYDRAIVFDTKNGVAVN